MPNTPARLPLFQTYSQPLYFVTCNTWKRRKLLANESVHRAFVEFAAAGESRAISVGRYVLMPDHMHIFVCGRSDFVLGQWVRLLKRTVSSAIDQARPHWQDGFFDHVVRHSDSYAGKWRYVLDNPVRAGLGQVW